MKILLMKPIDDIYYVIQPNLGLGYLAAIMLGKGHDVHILSSGKENLKWEEFTEGELPKATFRLTGKDGSNFIEAMESYVKRNVGKYDQTAELNATKYHLEDMRNLVFKIKQED